MTRAARATFWLAVALAASGLCLPAAPAQEEHDVITYGFGGGKPGSRWSELEVHQTGRMIYRYHYHAVPPGQRSSYPQVAVQERIISFVEFNELRAKLLDAGVWDFQSRTACCDMGGSWLSADLGGRQVKVEWSGAAGEAPIVRRIFDPLLARFELERHN